MAESALQRENLDMIDSIERLPDSLLWHILSFLPTKWAIRSSILSNRWKSLWTSLLNLDFDDETLSMTEARRLAKGMNFSDYVNKVLIIREGTRIRNFRLSCHSSYCEPNHVNTWIRAALDLNVEELYLSLFLDEEVPLPICLFNCKTLVVLKMMGNFIRCVAPSVCLPSLKILHTSITFFSEEDLKRLLSGCPILEELYLYGVAYLEAYKICVPTLKKLVVEFINLETANKIEINAPSLESLYVSDFYRRDYLVKNLDKVLKASLSLWARQGYTDCIFKILIALQNVQSLTLTHNTIESLLGVANLDLPVFHKLAYLLFDLTSFNWHFLTSLLEKSPNLKILVIQRTHGVESCSILRRSFSLGEESCWTEPSSVPVCLSTQLTEFKFRGFEGLKSAAELEFVRYVLGNSCVLNTVIIQPSKLLNLKLRFGLLSDLSMLPRGSKTCCLKFEQTGYLRELPLEECSAEDRR